MNANKIIPDFADRQKAAVEARQRALEKFKSKPGPGDPEFEKKRAERAAISSARAVREEQARLARVQREIEEKFAEEARIAAMKAAEEAAWVFQQAAEEERESDQKAKRDARYAARKAAKKNRREG